MATPVGWGPFRELCFIRSHPKGGGHWVHLRRAEGTGLLGRQGLRAEGRSFREKFNRYTISHKCPFLLPWGFISWARGPSLWEQGTVV